MLDTFSGVFFRFLTNFQIPKSVAALNYTYYKLASFFNFFYSSVYNFCRVNADMGAVKELIQCDSNFFCFTST